jgi:sulfur relay protein TusB/DsrH
MTLHVINKSLDRSSALNECLALLQARKAPAAILLIEDAVYAAMNCEENNALHDQLLNLGLPCYCLKEHIEMRGLSSSVADFFLLTDITGFVQLSLDFEKVQSWC